MENKKTKVSMMWVITTNLSKEFSKRKKLPFEKANKIIYKSNLYKMLEDDSAKMWYYSANDLTDFLIEEYETGDFDLSEKV